MKVRDKSDSEVNPHIRKLSTNFKELEKNWLDAERKHNNVSSKYEVKGVSTTLKAMEENLSDNHQASKGSKTSTPLKLRHR